MTRCLNCMNLFDETYGVCPHCGFIPGTPPKEAYHLYPGTILRGRYMVGTTVGFGGFGITYRAWDLTLDKKVAIKEFYPNGIVNRVPGQREVIVYSGNRADEFQNGKARFLAEARNMARFNTHPNIVNVYEFFEENNTAYIAMEFLDGMSYKQYIASQGGRVPVPVAVNVVLSVLDALKEIHKVKIIHRDVSPDNIFMVPVEPGSTNYKVKLIDFGAARFSSGEEEKTLSIILKPGYAPPEQYRSRSKQGPWTDIYAVGAVFYRSITGKMPEESVNRMVEDHLAPPNTLVPDLPQYLNDSILRAMALNQELRFQNVDQFREAIQQEKRVLSVDSELKRRKTMRGISVAAICLVLAGAALGCWQVYSHKQRDLYNVEATIRVEMPDVNKGKEEEIAAAGALGSSGNEGRQLDLGASSDMLNRMLEEYGSRFEKVTWTAAAGQTPEEYKKNLEKALSEEPGPEGPLAAFETSGITAADSALWGKLGSLDTTYETLDEKAYYFIDRQEFKDYFETEKKQIPISFRAPVLYVNTNLLVDPEAENRDELLAEKLEELAGMTDLAALTDAEGKPSYCVSRENLEMYRKAFGVAEKDKDFEPAAGDDKGYEPFLRREKACYLGNTDDYEAVRASLGGIYQMVVMEEMQRNGRDGQKVKGQFTHLWSISANLTEEQKTAADNLVFYLMSERAQDVFNLQSGNGLSLNKNMLETYMDSNDEFQDVVNGLRDLEMEYGEESET